MTYSFALHWLLEKDGWCIFSSWVNMFLFIKVDHEKYPIQCHFLINLRHLVHDYPILNVINKMA